MPFRTSIRARTGAYKGYLLAVLLVIQAFNYVDGLALGLVLQDIKVSLHLTDTELGFLTGIAFALFYSVMGIPLARWADRGDRAKIIALTTALWSVAVALCGNARTFLQLLLMRVGVAVGESGCVPPANSLIADYFARAERPRALGIYMLGAPLSALIGYFVAGWLNEFYGWRLMFVLLSLPGVILSVLAWTTLREPRRQVKQVLEDSQSFPTQPSARTVIGTLSRNLTFRHLLLSYAVTCFFGYGIQQWQPAFFVRSYGMDTGTLGGWFALVYGGGGIVGSYLGGMLASRYLADNETLQLKLMGVANASFGVLAACIYLSSNKSFALAMLGLAAIGGAATSGPLFACIQSLVPSQMRATATAVLYLFANLIGLGFGPLLAGALSDSLRPIFGSESLRFTLLALCPGYCWGGWHLWRASRSVARDLSEVSSDFGDGDDPMHSRKAAIAAPV